jgi:hypothetical protein
MLRYWSAVRRLSAASFLGVVLAGSGLRAASGQAPGPVPMEPLHDSGQSVTGAFEGWYQNPDGSFTMLVGYMNRNVKQALDIPVGPDNRIEPGGPDRGQPTHFLPRRQWGVFTIVVPMDFGNTKLTWTIVANGQTSVIPLSVNPLWTIDPFRHAMGNTPPKITFEPDGPAQQGPPRGLSASYTTNVGKSLTLTAFVTDDYLTAEGQPVGAGRGGRGSAAAGGRGTTGAGASPPVTLTWSKFRGPGDVTFAEPKLTIDRTDSKATTIATFNADGDYILRAQVNDASGEGGGGFQCCWTNAHVRVTVAPASGSR